MAEIDTVVLREIQEFARRLKDRPLRIEGLYLFGSYAKSRQHQWSDIDVAVVSPDFSGDRFEERVQLMRIASRIDDRLEPVPFRPETFSESDPLAWEIMRHGIKIEVG